MHTEVIGHQKSSEVNNKHKIKDGNLIIFAIAPGGENIPPCWTYSVRKFQVQRDNLWNIITA